MIRQTSTGCAFDFAYGMSDNLRMANKTDFRMIVSELRRAGWTQAALADYAKTRQSCVSDLERGVTEQPLYSTGAALVALHRRVRRNASKISSPGASAL